MYSAWTEGVMKHYTRATSSFGRKNLFKNFILIHVDNEILWKHDDAIISSLGHTWQIIDHSKRYLVTFKSIPNWRLRLIYSEDFVDCVMFSLTLGQKYAQFRKLQY